MKQAGCSPGKGLGKGQALHYTMHKDPTSQAEPKHAALAALSPAPASLSCKHSSASHRPATASAPFSGRDLLSQPGFGPAAPLSGSSCPGPRAHAGRSLSKAETHPGRLTCWLKGAQKGTLPRVRHGCSHIIGPAGQAPTHPLTRRLPCSLQGSACHRGPAPR